MDHESAELQMNRLSYSELTKDKQQQIAKSMIVLHTEY